MIILKSIRLCPNIDSKIHEEALIFEKKFREILARKEPNLSLRWILRTRGICHQWAYFVVGNLMHAGMLSTQRVEGMNSELKRANLNKNSTLLDLFNAIMDHMKHSNLAHDKVKALPSESIKDHDVYSIYCRNDCIRQMQNQVNWVVTMPSSQWPPSTNSEGSREPQKIEMTVNVHRSGERSNLFLVNIVVEVDDSLHPESCRVLNCSCLRHCHMGIPCVHAYAVLTKLDFPKTIPHNLVNSRWKRLSSVDITLTDRVAEMTVDRGGTGPDNVISSSMLITGQHEEAVHNKTPDEKLRELSKIARETIELATKGSHADFIVVRNAMSHCLTDTKMSLQGRQKHNDQFTVNFSG